MARYRIKRPVEIEAEQFWPDRQPWPEGVYRVGGSLPGDDPGLWWRIRFVEDGMAVSLRVKPGDWIITDHDGEKHVCKPAVFQAVYERVEEE